MRISLDKIEAFIFDFDGVLTNNFVYVDQEGKETVRCSRADGLAFDVLRKLNIPSFILSSETNPVVKIRADKLKIQAILGIANKEIVIKDLAKKNNYNLKNLIYIGNDLNDYQAMKICGYSICPADSHSKIKEISTFTLQSNGGNGVARELLEDIFNINITEVLYDN
ncbi:HAD hydrolase family protein [Alphaproteobacteria bacterium]|jgi:YrbI family 3-deoxy-D-manno-octulosonate 8-phosphate phosphatase|nr:HAD hydrolase family protein [Alphaproteobacteria bacterium]